MKKMLLLGGIIIALLIVLNLATNSAKKPKEYEITTTVAHKVEKFGSGWYVNDIFLDKAAKHGFFNPKIGDNIDLTVDSKERVVGWKINN